MLPSFAPVVLFWKCQPDYLAQNNVFIKRDQLFVISKVLAARARKNKRNVRMLVDVRKDHSIVLTMGLLSDTVVILNSIVSNSYYGMLRQQISIP